MTHRPAVLVLLTAITLACSGSTAPGPAPLVGSWGGETVMLTTSRTGAVIRVPCGGYTSPWAVVPGEDGRIAVDGTMSGTSGLAHATLTGTVDGDTVRATVSFSSPGHVSTFSTTLVRGAHFNWGLLLCPAAAG